MAGRVGGSELWRAREAGHVSGSSPRVPASGALDSLNALDGEQRAAAADRIAYRLIRSCGGSTPSAPTPSSTPQPTVAQLITIAQVAHALAAGRYHLTRTTIAQPGKLTVQLNWTYPTNLMAFGVATSSCDNDTYQAFQCRFLVWDAGLGATPSKTVTVTVAVGVYVALQLYSPRQAFDSAQAS